MVVTLCQWRLIWPGEVVWDISRSKSLVPFCHTHILKSLLVKVHYISNVESVVLCHRQTDRHHSFKSGNISTLSVL